MKKKTTKKTRKSVQPSMITIRNKGHIHVFVVSPKNAEKTIDFLKEFCSEI